MKIRKATLKDLPAIAKNDFDTILNSCSPLDELAPRTNSQKDDIKYYRKFVYSREKWIFVAEEGGKIAGFIIMKTEKRPYYYNIKKVYLLN